MCTLCYLLPIIYPPLVSQLQLPNPCIITGLNSTAENRLKKDRWAKYSTQSLDNQCYPYILTYDYVIVRIAKIDHKSWQ